jgi:DNA repair exonuclease SbcCD ATPase subunit
MGLLDLLIRPGDEEPAKSPAPAAAMKGAGSRPAVSAAAPILAAQAQVPVMTGSDPVTEAKVLEKLQKAIEENNRPGIDFFEFYKSVNAMTMIPDEATRYRAAYSSLLAQGADAQTLIKTADFYVEVLDSKETGFAQYIEAQIKERVQGKLNAAEAAKKQILEKSEQIARLTQEIGKLTESEVGARNEAAQAKAEIEAYQNTFKSVKTRLCAEIQGIKQKIASYVVNLPA